MVKGDDNVYSTKIRVELAKRKGKLVYRKKEIQQIRLLQILFSSFLILFVFVYKFEKSH